VDGNSLWEHLQEHMQTLLLQTTKAATEPRLEVTAASLPTTEAMPKTVADSSAQRQPLFRWGPPACEAAPEEHLLLSKPTEKTSEALKSFVSQGSVRDTIAASEGALLRLFSRMIIAKSFEFIGTVDVIEVLASLYESFVSQRVWATEHVPSDTLEDLGQRLKAWVGDAESPEACALLTHCTATLQSDSVLEQDVQTGASYTYWILGQCLSMCSIDVGVGLKMCRRLGALWSEAPAKAQPAILAALSRLPQDAIASLLAENEALRHQLLIAAATQLTHDEQRHVKSRLLAPPYTQALLEVVYKSQLLAQLHSSDVRGTELD
jgi:hypothetical protein